jgi:hypothetical protein
MISTIIFLVAAAFVVYVIVVNSAKAEADVTAVEADVKADVAKAEADIKKL